MNGLLKAYFADNEQDISRLGPDRRYPGRPARQGVTLSHGNCTGLESVVGGRIEFVSAWIVKGDRTQFIVGQLGGTIRLPDGTEIPNPFSMPYSPHMTLGWCHPYGAVDAKHESEAFAALVVEGDPEKVLTKTTPLEGGGTMTAMYVSDEDRGDFSAILCVRSWTLVIEFKPFETPTPKPDPVWVVASDVRWTRETEEGELMIDVGSDLEGMDSLVEQHIYYASAAAAQIECNRMNAEFEGEPYYVLGLQPQQAEDGNAFAAQALLDSPPKMTVSDFRETVMADLGNPDLEGVEFIGHKSGGGYGCQCYRTGASYVFFEGSWSYSANRGPVGRGATLAEAQADEAKKYDDDCLAAGA